MERRGSNTVLIAVLAVAVGFLPPQGGDRGGPTRARAAWPAAPGVFPPAGLISATANSNNPGAPAGPPPPPPTPPTRGGGGTPPAGPTTTTTATTTPGAAPG